MIDSKEYAFCLTLSAPRYGLNFGKEGIGAGREVIAAPPEAEGHPTATEEPCCGMVLYVRLAFFDP